MSNFLCTVLFICINSFFLNAQNHQATFDVTVPRFQLNEIDTMYVDVELKGATQFPIYFQAHLQNTSLTNGNYIINNAQLFFLSNGIQQVEIIFSRDQNFMPEQYDLIFEEAVNTGVICLQCTNQLTVWEAALQPTQLSRGDVMVVGYNANNGNCTGNSGSDLIHLVALKELHQGTTIDLIDNGWERGQPNRFGDTEGAWRLTLDKVSIPAGKVFSLQLESSISACNFHNTDWTFSDLSTIGNSTFNLNNGGDQFFLAQGGIWSSGQIGVLHDAEYTGGRWLSAFNSNLNGWASVGGNLSTQASVLPPWLHCYATTPFIRTDFMGYSGNRTATSKEGWLLRLTDASNWIAFSDCQDYNLNFTLDSIGILPSSTSSKTLYWTGAESTNWFACSNWSEWRIPTAQDTVIIGTQAQRDCSISAINSSGNSAKCKHLEISHRGLKIEQRKDSLHIGGHLVLSNGVLDLGMGGSLLLEGNFIKTTASALFNSSYGEVCFQGRQRQEINSTDSLSFYQLKVNKQNDHLYLMQSNLCITDSLSLERGNFINRAGYLIYLDSNLQVKGASAASYIDGPIIKITRALIQDSFSFPCGNQGVFAPIKFEQQYARTATYLCNYYYTGHPYRTVDPNHLDSISKTEYWVFEQLQDSITPVKLTLYWHPNSNLQQKMPLIAYLALVKNNQPLAWKQVPFSYRNGSITSGVLESMLIGQYGIFSFGFQHKNLPAKLRSFKVENNKGTALLEWECTEDEQQLTYSVERSLDGIDFESIEKVPSKLSLGIHSYSTTDKVLASGLYYYRLKLIDSKIQYSPIKSINLTSDIYESTPVTAYPNPFSDKLIIALNNPKRMQVLLELRDLYGNIVLQQQSTNTREIPLLTTALKAGLYYLSIQTAENGNEVIPVIKVGW